MTSHPEFGSGTGATEVAAVFGDSIKGKNVVVTGLSLASIGFSTAMAIALQGPANLVLASRTKDKLTAVEDQIHQAAGNVPIHTVVMDLSSVESVKEAAASIGRLVPHVDVLINNAGINTLERLPVTTPNGTTIDTHFFVNHLGVFLLTSLLLPQLRAAAAVATTEPGSPSRHTAATRVVNLSSQGHGLSPVRFSDYAFERDIDDVPVAERPSASLPATFRRTVDGYPGFPGYGQSKTANILHAWELTRRLRAHGESGVVALSVHPGTIQTELPRSLDAAGLDALNKTAPKGLWKTQDQGAATTLVAAFDPALGAADLGERSVGYLSDCQLRDDLVAAHASSAEAAQRLWEESERLLQISVGL